MKEKYVSLSSLKKRYSDFAEIASNHDFTNYNDRELLDVFNDETSGSTVLAAVVSEVIYRKKGLRLFKCQLATAAALFGGNIAELPTGEGKTLAAVVAAVLYAKSGRKVHILVFNDYLAKRDATDNKEIFDFFNISSSYVTENTDIEKRKKAYDAQILYVSAREAGYDCIRNFIVTDKENLVGGKFDVAIVDEADSILIDEASIPLVLAGKSEDGCADEKKITDIVSKLTPDDYDTDEQENQIWLNDSGIEKLENSFLVSNLYSDDNSALLAGINTALSALFMLKKDKDYIVKDGKIAVIDESTGRIAVNRKFPNSLHRFVEAKEGITDNINTKIYCTMTIGAFMEQYDSLCGMTGTAYTSADEFESTYHIRTVVIEPHTPCIREDMPDEVFLTNEDRDNAVINEIQNANKKGQPVLIGTSSVFESEKLYNELKELGISSSILNARNNEYEAEIIKNAGKPYSVTVSTNMAGRGVDIKLGGEDESEKDFVSSVGGLYVISTSINRSRRIDNQLRGRAGRQGDIGQSKFFISLEDETIAPFFEEEEKEGKKLSEKEKFALVRSAQKTLEGNEAEARYTLKKYSYIIEHQRQLLSKYRMQILNGEVTPDILKKNDFDYYLELEKTATIEGIEKAERTLLLYYINQHFAAYLEAMEEVKSGIHLTIVAGKNPFDEFNREAITAFDEMNDDIRFDVLRSIKEFEVTKDGIDMNKAGLIGATGTWTYMVDDSADQFSHLPELMSMISKKIKSVLSLGDRLERFLNRRKNK